MLNVSTQVTENFHTNISNGRDAISVRPGYNIHTKYLKDILGRTALTDISFGIALTFSHIKTKDEE